MDLCQIFDQESDVLNNKTLQKNDVHQRTSYKINYSCVDIILYTNNPWECSKMNFLYNEMNNSIIQ